MDENVYDGDLGQLFILELREEVGGERWRRRGKER